MVTSSFKVFAWTVMCLLSSVSLLAHGTEQNTAKPTPGVQLAVVESFSELDELDELDQLDELDGIELADQGMDTSSTAINSGWQERSFVGNSVYQISGRDDQVSIKGKTDGAASVLYRQRRVDLSENPYVRWRWKVSNTYGNLAEQTRQGDDYPARFYLVMQAGILPWDTLAVNYVWSSSSNIGDVWTNAYTDKARMIALQSGSELTGQWVSECRDIAADFKQLFDIDVAHLDGYAFMIDGDNSGSSGMAWFDSLQFDSMQSCDENAMPIQ